MGLVFPKLLYFHFSTLSSQTVFRPFHSEYPSKSCVSTFSLWVCCCMVSLGEPENWKLSSTLKAFPSELWHCVAVCKCVRLHFARIPVSNFNKSHVVKGGFCNHHDNSSNNTKPWTLGQDKWAGHVFNNLLSFSSSLRWYQWHFKTTWSWGNCTRHLSLWIETWAFKICCFGFSEVFG